MHLCVHVRSFCAFCSEMDPVFVVVDTDPTSDGVMILSAAVDAYVAAVVVTTIRMMRLRSRPIARFIAPLFCIGSAVGLRWNEQRREAWMTKLPDAMGLRTPSDPSGLLTRCYIGNELCRMVVVPAERCCICRA